MSEEIIDQTNPPDDYFEAYGDGFPQDEASQGTERIKMRDISRPYDPGFQNAEHIPLTKTHSGESITQEN